MGKWLTIEEVKNAQVEKDANIEKIENLKLEIKKLKLRNKRLKRVLNLKSYNSYRKNSVIYKMFGKCGKDLTKEERREYNKIKQKELREKRKMEKEKCVHL